MGNRAARKTEVISTGKPKNQTHERERKQMTLLEILIDNTNYEWEYDETGVIAVWVEGGQSLGVNAWFDLEAGDGTIVVMNEMVSDYYRIPKHQYHRLAIATDYAQFSNSELWGLRGTLEQFEAYATAMEVIGGEAGFAGTEDAIILTIGDPWVWVEWDGERYDLFQDGCHRYAATKDGLLSAYKKLTKEVEGFAAAMAKQQLQKTES